MAVGIRPIRAPFCILHGPLDKAVQFFSPGAGTDAQKIGKVIEMKKFLSMLLAAAMLLALAACGSSGNSGAANTPAPAGSSAPVEPTDLAEPGADFTGVEDGVLTVGILL